MNQPDTIPNNYLSDKELAALDEGRTISGPGQQHKWLHVGAFCTTRNGKKIRIICTDRASTDPGRHIFPVIGLNEDGDTCSFLLSGMSMFEYRETAKDLIGPWIEPIPWPWEMLPVWVYYCAFDLNGFAHCYSIKPCFDGFAWKAKDCLQIPSTYAPAWAGDWKLSLTERPKK